MHLGVIPDGNRRYARENGVSKEEAYREAKDTILDIFEDVDSLPADIDEATFYLLSEDNLKRSNEELDTLFKLLDDLIEETASQFNGNGFSFNWVSTRPEALPSHLREKLRELEDEYDSGERKLHVLISSSGRQDIVQAARQVSENGSDFSRASIRDHLGIGSEIDFVIRTGDNPAREAVSDFPIWNASYAEFYHVQKHFPAIETRDVEDALEHYQQLRRKRGE